jgi:hypothetical protein
MVYLCSNNHRRAGSRCAPAATWDLGPGTWDLGPGTIEPETCDAVGFVRIVSLCSIPVRPKRGPKLFSTTSKTTAFKFTKLGPPPGPSLALNQWLGRTSANPKNPAAAEFFIKVTCFAKANLPGTKM